MNDRPIDGNGTFNTVNDILSLRIRFVEVVVQIVIRTEHEEARNQK
jgi:hypothetical protein